jgi:hypothetical protein
MSTPLDNELAAALARELDTRCECGVLRTAAPAFHKATTRHDCIHHPRYRCWTCKGADRLIAGVEARLWVEVEHGPFEVARWAA